MAMAEPLTQPARLRWQRRARLIPLAFAVASMGLGLWLGLARLGLMLPGGMPERAELHGLLDDVDDRGGRPDPLDVLVHDRHGEATLRRPVVTARGSELAGASVFPVDGPVLEHRRLLHRGVLLRRLLAARRRFLGPPALDA